MDERVVVGQIKSFKISQEERSRVEETGITFKDCDGNNHRYEKAVGSGKNRAFR